VGAWYREKAVSTSVQLPDAYRLAYADWLQFPEDDGRLYEIVHGELLVSPTPSVAHQRISRRLVVLIDGYLAKTGSGEVFHAPTGVRLRDDVVLEPDLVVVLREHADRIAEQAIEGAPDLVVEILSPGTAGRDLGIKRDAFAEAGIPEYWIVDPDAETIEVLALSGDGYRRAGRYGRGETLRSPGLATLAIDLSDVFTP
jgi:Uma2 family endonuclease